MGLIVAGWRARMPSRRRRQFRRAGGREGASAGCQIPLPGSFTFRARPVRPTGALVPGKNDGRRAAGLGFTVTDGRRQSVAEP